MFVCQHLGLVLVVMQSSDPGGWAWEVSGRVGETDIRHTSLRPLPSLAHAKNGAVAAAARAVRIAA